jgi:hypothetical protein
MLLLLQMLPTVTAGRESLSPCAWMWIRCHNRQLLVLSKLVSIMAMLPSGAQKSMNLINLGDNINNNDNDKNKVTLKPKSIPTPNAATASPQMRHKCGSMVQLQVQRAEASARQRCFSRTAAGA